MPDYLGELVLTEGLGGHPTGWPLNREWTGKSSCEGLCYRVGYVLKNKFVEGDLHQGGPPPLSLFLPA